MKPYNFVFFRVWAPGQAPTSSEPLLTLHNLTSIRFFVESAAYPLGLFVGKPFAVCAYEVISDLIERQVAEGTYRIDGESDNGPKLHTLFEASCTLKRKSSIDECMISTALLDACVLIRQEREQIL